MNQDDLIPVTVCCTYYEVEFSLLRAFEESGLIEIQTMGDQGYIPLDQLKSLERMILFYRDLNINPEGIEAITHLLGQIDQMQEEMKMLRNRLSIYESR